jgi:hypothetical protein
VVDHIEIPSLGGLCNTAAMSSSTRTKRKDQDRSSHSGKKRDDVPYSDMTPRVVPDLAEDFAELQIDSRVSSQNEPEYVAEQGMESSGKGKEKADYSTWSEWEWAQEYNCHSRCRQNAQGEWEYEYSEFPAENSRDRTNVC